MNLDEIKFEKRHFQDLIEYHAELLQILSTVLLDENGRMKKEFVKNKVIEDALLEVEYQWARAYCNSDSDYLKKLIESRNKLCEERKKMDSIERTAKNNKIILSSEDEKTFLKVLKIFEERSTCSNIQCAALIIKDKRIVSTGWNGSPPGGVHCKDYFYFYQGNLESFRRDHHEWSLKNEIHAEQNAIAHAAKCGISTENTIMVTSFSPCFPCAKLIIAAGIKTVYFQNLYDKEDTREYLKKFNVDVYQIGAKN
jgi:dCMP deaminase